MHCHFLHNGVFVVYTVVVVLLCDSFDVIHNDNFPSCSLLFEVSGIVFENFMIRVRIMALHCLFRITSTDNST